MSYLSPNAALAVMDKVARMAVEVNNNDVDSPDEFFAIVEEFIKAVNRGLAERLIDQESTKDKV